jgi:hypothetical protein
MDLHRLRTADWLTGVSGLALLLLLWAPWYTVSGGDRSAWSAFTLVDLWFALTALLGVAAPVVTAVRDAPALPVAIDVLCWSAAAIAVLLVLIRLLALPSPVTGRDWGLYAGAVAVLGVCAGAWRAMRDESAPGIR